MVVKAIIDRYDVYQRKEGVVFDFWDGGYPINQKKGYSGNIFDVGGH
jgi:hypothetical protein